MVSHPTRSEGLGKYILFSNSVLIYKLFSQSFCSAFSWNIFSSFSLNRNLSLSLSLSLCSAFSLLFPFYCISYSFFFFSILSSQPFLPHVNKHWRFHFRFNFFHLALEFFLSPSLFNFLLLSYLVFLWILLFFLCCSLEEFAARADKRLNTRMPPTNEPLPRHSNSGQFKMEVS